MYTRPPTDFPVVSVLTITAIDKPQKKTFDVQEKSDSRSNNWVRRKKEVFKLDRDRELTKAKMRLGLRIAVRNKHRWLVLGAFGCGALDNPPEDVAHCWLEVLREDEFAGNRWREVWFAVHDRNNNGSYDKFRCVLSGGKV